MYLTKNRPCWRRNGFGNHTGKTRYGLTKHLNCIIFPGYLQVAPVQFAAKSLFLCLPGYFYTFFT